RALVMPLTKDLVFFTLADDSFKPIPYTPNRSATPTKSHKKVPVQPRVPSQPKIFSPFSVLPLFLHKGLYPGGITYRAVAESSWLLDLEDYLYEGSKNPKAISYPRTLEPPPGRDSARFRCTFCPKAYAGMNAKSMWRRHVLDKHRILLPKR
ncbi:hypothetical protein B0H13DRAFT_1496580, partial [Mycena leptocephala]